MTNKIDKEVTVTHAKANFKVGVAFAGVIGGSVVYLCSTNTAGLLTMTASGGVICGYYWRGKRI